MFDSIHSSRWLSQFSDQEIDFYLFPSSPHRLTHPIIQGLVARETVAKYSLVHGSSFSAISLWILDKIMNNHLRGALVRIAVERIGPDVIHALELQNAGYLLERAVKRHTQPKTRLLVSNWGSDVYWFMRFPEHRRRLQALLRIADAYSCECDRDVSLAKELGFGGKVMPVIPNAGGFSAKELNHSVPFLADRKVIAVKGYHGWVGRAKIALSAIEGLADSLGGYQIVIYSANATTVRLAKKVAKSTGLDFIVHKKGKLRHEQVLDLFASAKIYVGLSLSDGISTSLLESMAMGAIPVQTSTACCDEWFSTSGVKVDEISVEAVKTAILKGLELAESQELSDLNREIIRTRANAEDISAIAKTFYD